METLDLVILVNTLEIFMSVLFNKCVKDIPIKDILGTDVLNELRNHYIHRQPFMMEGQVLRPLLKSLRRRIMYRIRKENYMLTNIQAYWDDQYLKIAVWHDFIVDCRQTGMTTQQISILTQHPLKEVNIYAR